MYDIKWIRDQPEVFDHGLRRRGLEPLSSKLIKLDETRRALITKLEHAQARRNAASKEIGQAKAKKDDATAGETAKDSNTKSSKSEPKIEVQLQSKGDEPIKRPSAVSSKIVDRQLQRALEYLSTELARAS